MSFDAQTATIQDVEKYKASLLADISKYGKDLDAIQENIKKAKQEESDSVDAITQSHSSSLELQTSLSTLQEQVSSLTKEKTALLSDIKNLEDMKSEKDKLSLDLKVISEDIESKKTELSTIQTTIENSNKELSNISDKIKTENDSFDKLSSDNLQSKNELSSVYDSMKASHNQEITGLGDKVTELQSAITSKTLELSEKIKAHEDLSSKYLGLVSKINTLQSDHDIKKSALEKELSDKQVASSQKESELSEREGGISLKETQLENATINLRKVKVEMEKQLGKSININL